MYTKYYRLTKSPFENTPDPDFLFLSKNHREVLASLTYAVSEAKGFVFVIGDIGTGKTTLIHALIKQLDPSFVILTITNPRATFNDILHSLGRRLGIPAENKGLLEMFEAIQQRLETLHEQGSRHAVLIIDEAHLLSDEALENIRLISNIENERRKLIQIILVGQNELNAKLQRESLRPLKQRLVVTRRLFPLDRKETLQYILHRLRIAGRQSQVFERKALTLIWTKSRGIPRLINQICDNALLIGYATEARSINGKIIREVIQDMESADKAQRQRSNFFFSYKWMGAVTIPILLFIVYLTVGFPPWNNSSSKSLTLQENSVVPQTEIPNPPQGAVTKSTEELPNDGSNLAETGVFSKHDKKGPYTDQIGEVPPSRPQTARTDPFLVERKSPTLEQQVSADREKEIFETSWPGTDEAGVVEQSQKQLKSHSRPGDRIQTSSRRISSGQEEPGTAEKTGVQTRMTVSSRPGATETGASGFLRKEAPSTPETSIPMMSEVDLINNNSQNIRRAVKSNDCLYDLAVRKYGIGNATILDLIQMANPGIKDVNRIYPGQEIILPSIRKEDLIVKNEEATYQIYYASFYNQRDAEIRIQNLMQEGKQAFMISTRQGDTPVHRVYVGTFRNKEDALNMLKTLELKHLTFLVG